MDFSPQEIMVAAAAREIRDGEIVFTGMRLPLIAFALAKQMHAPHAIGLFECGLVRDTPAPELLYTMGDPPNIAGALWATRMINIMGLLQQGAVDLGFIGDAQLLPMDPKNGICEQMIDVTPDGRLRGCPTGTSPKR